MRKLILLFSLFLSSICSYSQIKSNEKLVYAASYEISGLMTNIAQVTMKTETISTSKNNFLHLSLEAATFNKWDTFFKIRDLYESYVNPVTLKPSMYKRSIFEGSYAKTEKYIFTSNTNTISSTSKTQNRAEKKNTVSIGAKTMDIVSLIYKLRTVDYCKLKIGQSVSYTIVFDEKEYPVSVKLLGKGVMPAGNLGKKECYKLSLSAKTDKLKGKDKNILWISTDADRIPCAANFSIPVGVGQLVLSQATKTN